MRYSILGRGNAQIEKQDATKIEILYSRMSPNWHDSRDLEDESIINGTRRFIHLWTHCDFSVTSLLCKESVLATRAAYFNTLIALEHTDVYFYPFIDGVAAGDGLGKPIEDSGSNKVLFNIIGMEPGSMDDFNRYDILTIFLKSKTPFDITKSIQ